MGRQEELMAFSGSSPSFLILPSCSPFLDPVPRFLFPGRLLLLLLQEGVRWMLVGYRAVLKEWRSI